MNDYQSTLGMHHNSGCKLDHSEEECFGEYTTSLSWKNVVVKMLNGAFAYANEKTCNSPAECPRSLSQALKNLPKLLLMVSLIVI